MNATCIGVQATTLWQICTAVVLQTFLLFAIGWQLVKLGESIQRRRTLQMLHVCEPNVSRSPAMWRLWAGVLTGELPPLKEEGETQDAPAVLSDVEETPLGNDKS